MQLWCDKNIPTSDIAFTEDLVPALTTALQIEEHQLQLLVHQEFLNKASFAHATVQHWVESSNLTELQYLRHYSNLDNKVDGLFLWLATIATKTHLNFVHQNRVWTSHASEKPDVWDALIVSTQTHFLAARSQNGKLTKMEIGNGFCDPLDTAERFVSKPVVLRNLVHGVAAHSSEIGVMMMGSPHPLQHLLTELCGLPVIQYIIHLVVWMKQHKNNLQVAQKWCQACGQEISNYYEYLGQGGPADGLEVLLTSLAINTHISI